MEQSCENDFNGINAKTSWKPLLRQMFVCSGVTLNFFISGLFFGAPTVFIPQIRNQTKSIEIMGIGTVSWLFSIPSYGSIPWTLICILIAEKYGRKVPYIALGLNTIVSVSLFYFSTCIIELLISGFLQGMYLAIQITVGIMVLTEYTSPKYRGMLITFKGATFFWGIWISNAIGTFYHWKNIGLLIFICCIYNGSIIFWPESPVWLATKGRFEECAKYHRWLKGNDNDSEKELQELICMQKDNLKRKQERQLNKQKNYAIKLCNSIKSKSFYKPLIYSYLATCLYHFSGKLACTGYIVDIIKTITLNESTAYEGMLILDGVTVFGMYVGVSLNKFLRRRTLLLGSASIGVIFLFVLSFYLYLVHMNVVLENKYLTLLFLTGFSVAISCGPMIMCACVTSEMIPIKSRSFFLVVYAILSNGLMGTVIKMFPYLFKYLNPHGAFLFFAIMSSIFICILYKVLPETKNKTILEIEKCISDESSIVKEEVELLRLEEAGEKNLLSSVRN